ncbi:MAG: rhomboid family intramembrane serine protease [Myxococcales bacterium]|nr:rhomboid family intramembrane serine protease [Myxococcales bacterium]
MGQRESAMVALRREFTLYKWLLLFVIASWWVVEAIDTVLPGMTLDVFGIRPRTQAGLVGILLAPFLHGGFQHVLNNSIGMLFLGGAVILRSVRDYVVVFLSAMFVGGLGVWLIAPSNSVHIGASGVVYGYLGYLLTTGWFERKPLAIVLSVVAAVLWGGLLPGVLPGQPGISWQGHLFGCLGGVLAASYLAKRAPAREAQPNGAGRAKSR